MIKKLNEILYSIELLHESHTRSEHIAAYVTTGSLLLIAVLIPLVAFDEFVLGGAARPILEFVAGCGLAGFGIGCILAILATNKFI